LIFIIYTSFQANKVKSTEIFKYLLLQLMKESTQKYNWEELALFTWDYTTIYTNKLLGDQWINQQKIFSVINLRNSGVSEVGLHFGTNHDSKYRIKQLI
jgi:hypothetical protein